MVKQKLIKEIIDIKANCEKNRIGHKILTFYANTNTLDYVNSINWWWEHKFLHDYKIDFYTFWHIIITKTFIMNMSL